jgi:diguanylate cyclase (GGDEF)-like protein
MKAEAAVLHDEATILIVEDDPDLRTILRAILERDGYLVESASDGEEGLERVDAVQPDLILLDVMMPKLDGRQVCQALKANHRTSQIPIIMLTAMTEPEDRIGGLDLGANDYVSKPYDQRELLRRVRNLLDWGRLQRDANPLTGLPGHQGIEGNLVKRIAARDPFVFMYLDVDHFKAFNDFYSYQKGDQVIRLLARIIRETVDDFGDPTDFVGHIGGDDFVIICGFRRAERMGQAILEKFDREIPQLYSQTDRARGYIETVDRQGVVQAYPVMTLTIAAVSNEGREIEHVAQVSDIAAELKRFGKEQKQSVLIWDRRSD